ncbi:hypothetical protein L6164_032310 [Bauhinia variegata]|uniref:Uncharacterized protein n=1 Tax=Bauhinia variegata TaxID=167791 RepID=A0ACB9KNG1_BAUVA|nr:hypothetical protein L6164_032310 [Bauhinia variegata]
MGRESHYPTVVHSHSSIALLQERFRQLQRVKEMREERELLKLVSQPKQLNHNPTTSYEPTRLFFHPELVVPSRSPPHVSLTLWPTPLENHTRSPDIPASTSLRSKVYPYSLQASRKNVYDCDHSDSESDSGVDTSLHL